MNNLLNYGMQKRFLFYSFLFIFLAATVFFLWNLTAAKKLTETIVEKVTEDITLEITKKLAEELTLKIAKDATSDILEELSKEIIDTEVLNRVKDLPIGKASLVKLMQDIIVIEAADNLLPDCEQYVLRVIEPGMFPILQTTHNGRPEIKGWIWLNFGEEWRCGITAFDKEKRYPGGVFFVSKDGTCVLTDENLEYFVEFKGTMKEVLIEEKIKIYSYSLLPECIKRVKLGEKLLLIHPGNKVHK